jgi:protein disulfide-isomerase A1
MIKNVIIFFALIALSINDDEKYKKDKDTLLFDDNNFGIALREFKYMLLFLYSPSDENGRNLIPEFEKVATLIKPENYVAGKIDTDKSRYIVEYLKIDIIPSIILLNKGKSTIYEGLKKADKIINWLKEETKIEIKTIANKTELEEFKKNKFNMLYFGKNEKIIQEFILVDRKIEDIPMAIVNSDELINENKNKKKIEKNEFIMLNTPYDERTYYLYEFKAENILHFHDLYYYPKVIEYNMQTADLFLIKKYTSLVYFASKNSKYWEEGKKILSNIWDKLNQKLKLFVSVIDEGASIKIADFCGVKNIDKPKVFLMESNLDNPLKYEFQGEINEKNLLEFVQKWEKKEISPFYRSEPIPDPDDNEGDIFIVVGKSFKKEVLDNDKDVVVYFYSPWCKYCKAFYPDYENLARKLKAKNPKLLFTKMDATENDIEYYPINRYPTIKFYPGNAKNKAPIHIYNKQNVHYFLEVIKKNAFHKVNSEDYDGNKENLTTDL